MCSIYSNCLLNSILIRLHIILDPNFAFVLSRRGKPQLFYNGHLFTKDGFVNGRVYWRCSETRRGTCMARLLTTTNSLTEKQPIHDHPPNPNRTQGKKFLSFTECLKFFSQDWRLKRLKIVESNWKQNKTHFILKKKK